MHRRALYLITVCCLSFITIPSARAADVPATPMNRPLPEYPAAAGSTEGSVKLQYRIAVDGHVSDVHVLASDPPGVFEAAATAAVAQWRYHPRETDGQPVEQPENSVLLKFKPPQDDGTPEVLRPERAFYPRKAFEEKLEGDVTVAFDINGLGLVEHPVVLESTLPLVFDSAALKSLETLRFRPRIIDGKRQAFTGVQMTIPFRIATARIAPRLVSSTQPSYPDKALNAGIQGYCTILFWIRDDGSVENPEFLDSYPGDVFRQACLDYVGTIRYVPPGSDPLGHIDRCHSLHISFVIGNPGYGAHYDLKPGEWVKIKYTVTTEGHIKKAQVVETSGPDVETDSALEQIRRRHMKPFMVNGVAVERPDQFIVVTGPEG